MTRKKEYNRKSLRGQKYADELQKLMETIRYEEKHINQKLDDYYDEKMERLERASFKKELDSFHNKVNYSRFLMKKLNYFK